ncbi:MAG: HAAS signaling domain-containing protein [Planctomycetota bacterium]|jgi:hypothetical protein
MSSENKMWDEAKSQYLHQVEKALASVKNSRKKEVLDDVRSHLERRFGELRPEQKNWENIQKIITDMGPPTDYAELLEPGVVISKWDFRLKCLLWFVITAVVVVAGIITVMTIFVEAKPVTLEEFRRDFPQKVAGLNIDTASLDDVIRIFGEPVNYVWGQQVIDRKEVPAERYCVIYPADFSLYMRCDSIVELRFESPAADYVFGDKIRVGSSLDDVLAVLGEPIETIVGKANQFKDGVLYKDIDGKKGLCYYGRSDQSVRMFFWGYKVTALYITRSDYDVR